MGRQGCLSSCCHSSTRVYPVLLPQHSLSSAAADRQFSSPVPCYCHFTSTTPPTTHSLDGHVTTVVSYFSLLVTCRCLLLKQNHPTCYSSYVFSSTRTPLHHLLADFTSLRSFVLGQP